MFARLTITIVTIIAATASFAYAQSSPQGPKWEFLISSGQLVPTGAQRHEFDRGNLTALQVGLVADEHLVVTTSAGWGRTRSIGAGTPRLDVFTYDLGAEVRASKSPITNWLSVMPFAGIGGGGRSYNYRHLPVDATHNVAGYISLGAELGIRWGRLRLEARNYVGGFKPLDGSSGSATRNDVVVLTGVRIGR